MGGFSDDLVGGLGKLIRTFISSANYLAGSLGWIIKKNGDAEFNAGTFRGTLSLGPAAGAHMSIGPTLPAELTAYYVASGLWNSISTYTILMFPNSTDYYYHVVGVQAFGGPPVGYAFGVVKSAHVVQIYNHEWDGGTNTQNLTYGATQPPGNDYAIDYHFINPQSPVNPVNLGTFDVSNCNILLGAGLGTPGADPGSLEVFVRSIFDSTMHLKGTVTADGLIQIQTTGDLMYGTNSLARGPVVFERISATISGATDGLEHAMYTTAAYNFPTGRAYQVEVSGLVSAAATERIRFRVRKGTGIAGTLLSAPATTNIDAASTDVPVWQSNIFVNTSGALVNTTLTVTWQTGATAPRWDGPGGGSTPAFIRVIDAGDANIYTGVSL